ncbi:Tn3 family transposase [Streptomyces sp. YIM S03343]
MAGGGAVEHAQYTKWLHFGGDGYLRSRDSELQEKAVKFLDLMANSIIFSTTVDMTDTLCQMAAQGRGGEPRRHRRAQPAPQGQRAALRRLRHRHLHIPPGPYDSARFAFLWVVSDRGAAEIGGQPK